MVFKGDFEMAGIAVEIIVIVFVNYNRNFAFANNSVYQFYLISQLFCSPQSICMEKRKIGNFNSLPIGNNGCRKTCGYQEPITVFFLCS